MNLGGKGPSSARIVIVGEAYGATEDEEKAPFVGESGKELTRMLTDAGIDRNECYLTNVINLRPPDNDLTNWLSEKKKHIKERDLYLTRHGLNFNDKIQLGLTQLFHDLSQIRPNVVIALGNAPLWALTGHWGITSWRNSTLQGVDEFAPFKVVPTFHPAGILRQWENRFFAVHDLRHARLESLYPEVRYPPYSFHIRPSFEKTCEVLQSLITKLDSGVHLRVAEDLETRWSLIACCGIAWSNYDAICIPFLSVQTGERYFQREQELIVIKLLRRLLTHPNVEVVGQNFTYDEQYNARYWGFKCNTYMDTMIAHHLCWPGTPKGLDHLSSLYCRFHQYWKDEGKEFDPRNDPEEQWWGYNCKDAVVTYECSYALDAVIRSMNLTKPFQFQKRVYNAVFDMMLRGVDVDLPLRNKMALELLEAINVRESTVNRLSGGLNVRSPQQLQEFFYHRLNLPVQFNPKTKRPTTDEDALKELAKVEPLVQKLCYAIIESRTIGAGLNVLKRPLGNDNRLRCSYNISGTETFRFSSKEDAFDSGTNLQNLTSGGPSEFTGYPLPNMRNLIVPPPGYVIVDVDLDRADLQVVVWEAEDEPLKEALRAGVDMHLYNARDIFNLKNLPDDELIETHPACREHKLRFALQRQYAKNGVHATDYGAYSRTLARTLGITVHAADQFRTRWFAVHPGIKKWHERTQLQLSTNRTITNRFGFHRIFLDRISSILPEALAWLPQSTVALVINEILIRIHERAKHIFPLLQVHDSLTLAVPQPDPLTILANIYPLFCVTIPYDDPLTIPVSFKQSPKSWGLVKGVSIALPQGLVKSVH
jgi:DNA polymerase I-like protein with 3'-5' exonuclease and polymerase domains/uracil-DNA glycosylase